MKNQGIECPENESLGVCETCVVGKLARRPFPKTSLRKTRLLELIHTDLCGPMREKSLSGAKYFATGSQIKCVQSDNGKEYRNHDLDQYLENCGINRRFSIPHTPEQNGVAERKNRTLVEMARCLLISSNLPSSFWAEAVLTANHLRNRCPSRSLHGATPFEKWTGVTPNLSYQKLLDVKDSR